MYRHLFMLYYVQNFLCLVKTSINIIQQNMKYLHLLIR